MQTVDRSLAGGEVGSRRRAAGAVDLRKHYIQAAVSGELEETKGPERQRVMRFILDNHEPDRRPWLLTNPGPLWTFERAVEAELGVYGAYFVGVERSWPTLEYGLRWMPGNKDNRSFRLNLRSEDVRGYISSRATIIHASVEYVGRQIKYHKSEPIQMYRNRGIVKKTTMTHLTNYTGCWIDIWSPLGRPEIALALRALPGLFDKKCSRIPFAFTFQYGRDDIGFGWQADPVGARAEGIRSELMNKGGAFDIRDYWYYFGPNDSRLATVCGVFRWS